MTDKLHNHIAAMVCETDEPGKPADVTGDLIRRADALKAIDPGDGDFHLGNYMAIAALPAVQVDAAHIRAEALREAISLAYTSIVHGGLAKSMAHFLRADDHATYRAAIDAYAEKIEALIPTPTPSPDVGALERIADRITAQVDCTRETMKQAALPKSDLSTLELLTSHFLDMADDLRAALAKLKGGAARALAAQEGGE